MKRQYLFFTFCFFLLAPSLRAQYSGPAFHLDKPFYVTGDVLRYKLYLPPAYAGQEIALKMTLVNAGGEPVDAFYQHTGGNSGLQGYLKLPYDLESAVYHLMALGTDRSSLRKVKLAEIPVPVYNDLVEENLAANNASDAGSKEQGEETLSLSIDLPSGTFHKREDIQAQVKVTDRNGRPVAASLSASVIDAALFGPVEENGLQLSSQDDIPAPEELSDQLLLNGRIYDEAGQPRASISFGAYVHDLRASLIGTTDEAGNFALPLPQLTGSADIQFMDLRNDSLRVTLDDGVRPGASPPLPYNDAIAEYLKWSRSRKVIYQLYNTVETKLEPNHPKRALKKMEPGQRVILAEYPDFKNLVTFFTEVGATLKFKVEKDGSYTAQMFNPDPRMRVFYQGTPIFIVDGKMTRNVDYIQQLELNRIDTIDIYFDFFNLNKNFDKLGSSGVVVLKTNMPNLRLPAGDEVNIFSINGLLAEAKELTGEEKMTHRPEFRSNLYWSPDLSAGSDGLARLRFQQSDDLGTFLIQVVARTADGRIGTATKKYEVQW